MKLAHRISGLMVAAGLLIGGSVVMAAPAQAASYQSPLYPTKDQCVGASWSKARDLTRQGYKLNGGTACEKATINGKTGWHFWTLYY